MTTTTTTFTITTTTNTTIPTTTTTTPLAATTPTASTERHWQGEVGRVCGGTLFWHQLQARQGDRTLYLKILTF